MFPGIVGSQAVAPLGEARGAASGLSEALGIGAKNIGAPGSASGSSTVSAVGAKILGSAGASSGAASVSGVGDYSIQSRATYFDALSSGDRTASITVSTTFTLGSGTISKLIDGSLTASSAGSCFFNSGQSSGEIKFDFGTAKIVDGFRWIQSIAGSQGTFVLEGSNDNTNWTQIGSSFTLGSVSVRGYDFVNGAGYRYYRLRQTAGTTSNTPWLEEIHFRIADPTDPVRDPIETGDRTGLITITTTATPFTGSQISNLIDGAYGANATDAWGFGANESTREIKFALGSAKAITDFELFSNTTSSHGTWVMEGSNDNSNWTGLGSSFTLGGILRQRQSLSNSTAYLYYRLRQTAGSTNTSPWLIEIEFKI